MPDKVRTPRLAAETPGRPAGASRPAPSELVAVDPQQLLTDANVRTDLRLTPAFVDSVRQHGVLEPITARRDQSGALVIQRGHRRAAAAVAAGLAEVRVLVEPGLPARGADNTAAADVLVTQLVENDHRDGLVATDRISAYSQLAAFGLKVGDIVKSTGAKKAEVDKALAVAGNDLASKAAVRYDLTLDEAFAVSEFTGDTEAVKALVAAKKTGQFDHVAQQLRDQRDYRVAERALRATLTETGVKILDNDRGDIGGVRLSQLKHGGVPLDEPGHASCEYRAAWLKPTYDERHVAAVEVCTDPTSAGHTPRFGDQLPNTAGAIAGTLSETQKKQRREVRENNTAWRSAQTVRRQFLATLMAGSGKKLPPGTCKFIAESIAGGDHGLRRALERGHGLTRELLKLKGGPGALHTAVAQAGDGKAELLTLAMVLGAYEASTDVSTWRQPSQHHQRYFGFLEQAGYTLSEVETKATGKPASRPKTAAAKPSATKTAAAKTATTPRATTRSPRPARAGWSPKTKPRTATTESATPARRI